MKTGQSISIFFKKPAKEKFLLIQILLLLAIIRMALLIVPFNKLAGLLGEPNRESDTEAGGVDWAYAGQITRYIRKASAFVPWQSKCLAQAIAAKMLLRRRQIDSTVYFGVKKGESNMAKLEAHAWLRVGGTVLLGGENAHEFVRVSSFS